MNKFIDKSLYSPMENSPTASSGGQQAPSTVGLSPSQKKEENITRSDIDGEWVKLNRMYSYGTDIYVSTTDHRQFFIPSNIVSMAEKAMILGLDFYINTFDHFYKIRV